jgi:hypothetical protein
LDDWMSNHSVRWKCSIVHADMNKHRQVPITFSLASTTAYN